ncbi:hypothetical protein ALC57_00477 [Trachymyrmex cornetzi]|uniref:Uncharacterized protein n=1 Tax=Trachymyrmex cornetzi TaxID=471704 RepID=A0A151JRT0_9HYME|nr:hypothetical protein ALC57_00477 [Trachymyrmex cornetzi]
MEEFLGKKANSNLYVFSGYIYHQDKRYQYIYRCRKRRNFKCRGRLEQRGKTFIVTAEHDHPPNIRSSEMLKMKREMKEMCKNRYINNKEIFDNVSRRYLEAAISLSYNTIRTPLYREKIKHRPPLPRNLLSLQTQLETYEPLKNIYKGHAMSTDGKIALIFSTNELLKQLDSSTEIYLDGTFSAVFRKWKSLNLVNAPRDVLSMTMTLPLAPSEYFLEGYKIIEKQADTMEEYPDIHLFLAYLRRNWLCVPSKVSVYKCPARTNNVVESFNNVAFKKFNTKHPNLWIFLGNYYLLLFAILNG